MTPNTTPEKPEWFQLTDSDAPSAQVKRVSKKLPAIAVIATGAIIASGAFFANASEKNESHNNLQQSQLSTDDSLSQNDGALNGTGASDFAPSNNDSSNPSQILPTDKAGAGVTAPIQPGQGIKPSVPGLGGDDEDEGHEGRRFHDGGHDGDHEGGYGHDGDHEDSHEDEF